MTSTYKHSKIGELRRPIWGGFMIKCKWQCLVTIFILMEYLMCLMCLHEYKKRYLYQISTTYNVYNQVNIVNFVVKLGKGCRVK